jgi:excisionase family DNA binding protein
MRNDEVLTTEEAIRYLKISRPTYLKCIHQGKIKAVKVGNGWRVLQSELHRFLKAEGTSNLPEGHYF